MPNASRPQAAVNQGSHKPAQPINRTCGLPAGTAPAHKGTQLEAKAPVLRCTLHTRVTAAKIDRQRDWLAVNL